MPEYAPASRLAAYSHRRRRKCQRSSPAIVPVNGAICACLGAAALLSGCKDTAPPQREATLVKVISARLTDAAPLISVTGEIKARFQNDLSFRISGKIIERNVDAGAHVMPGDVLARLDPQEQEANLKSAQAAVEAAEAQVKQAASAFERQKTLLAGGYTTRRDFDQTQEGLRTAEAALDTAKSQRTAAEDQLGYTVLTADRPGIITARSAEMGQVVQTAQPVFTLARDGARDAVFDADEALLTTPPPSQTIVRVVLASDPSAHAEGRVREIAPTVNADTGTIRVKIGLENIAPQMTLGAVVFVSDRVGTAKGFAVPWNALSKLGHEPAVWIASPKSRNVSLQPVVLARYEAGRVILKSGLEPGQLVVTAGSQQLHPGQIVTAVEEAGQ